MKQILYCISGYCTFFHTQKQEKGGEIKELSEATSRTQPTERSEDAEVQKERKKAKDMLCEYMALQVEIKQS